MQRVSLAFRGSFLVLSHIQYALQAPREKTDLADLAVTKRKPAVPSPPKRMTKLEETENHIIRIYVGELQ